MNKNELMKEKKFFRKKIVKNPNTRLQDGSDRRIEPFNGINIGRLHDNQISTYMHNLMSCRVHVTKPHLT